MKGWINRQKEVFLALFLIYVVPITILYALSEKPEMTGRTEISSAVGRGGQHPNDNYAVYRKGRYIYLATGLMPATILERDGTLVRVDTLLAGGRLPIRFYRLATPEEEALWHRHFS